MVPIRYIHRIMLSVLEGLKSCELTQTAFSPNFWWSVDNE